MIVDEGELSNHNIMPQYMIDLLDGPALHDWIMKKRFRDR